MIEISEKIIQMLQYYLQRDSNLSLKSLNFEDYSEFYKKSNAHSISPIIYQCLVELSKNHIVPNELITMFKKDYLNNLLRNIRIYNEVSEVLTRLKEAGIPVIVLKGAFLGELIYKDIGLRYMGDVDFLIKKSDISKARQVMLDMGYSFPDNFHFSPLHLPPFSKNKSVVFEIHWTIIRETEPLSIEESKLWERAIFVKIAGVEALALSIPDLFIHLCLHTSYSHRFNNGLIPLIDISLIIKYYLDESNWKIVSKISKGWKTEKYVYVMIYIINKILKIEISNKNINRYKVKDVNNEVINMMIEQIFLYKHHVFIGSSTNNERLKKYLSLATKIKYTFKGAFPSIDEIKIKYSPHNIIKWYFKHIICFIIKRTVLIIKYICGNTKELNDIILLSKRKMNDDIINQWLKKIDCK